MYRRHNALNLWTIIDFLAYPAHEIPILPGLLALVVKILHGGLVYPGLERIVLPEWYSLLHFHTLAFLSAFKLFDV